MPTYTYACTSCEDVIEKRQSFSDPPLTTCEQCGGGLRKVIHPVGIVFKGSGWYITDSRAKTSTNGTSGDKKNGASKDEKPAASASCETSSSEPGSKEPVASSAKSETSTAASSTKTV